MFSLFRRSFLNELRALKAERLQILRKECDEFESAYNELTKTKKAAMLYVYSDPPTQEQEERIDLVSKELEKLNDYEIRGLFYVLAEKSSKILKTKPSEIDFEASEYKMRNEKMWPTLHPMNLHAQQEIGKGALLGMHGYPNEFMNKLESGEMFNPIDMSAATIAAPSADAAEEVAAEPEQEAFDIVLRGFKKEAKLKIIKEIKGYCNLGLKEAKELVEGAADAPVYLFKKVDKEPKKEMVDKLKELGAEIDFE